MRLTRLRLSDFRNLAAVDLEIPPGVSVYFGQNAQGKTTLVEAVYLLAIARSFRADNERELVNFAAAQQGGLALVEGLLEDDAPGSDAASGAPARQRVIIGYRASPIAGGPGYRVNKQIRVNRIRRTAGSLVGLVHAVLFSALDIGLIQGPPSARRRFLDILISQADPLYLQALQRYQRVLQQRNRLLRLRRDGRARPRLSRTPPEGPPSPASSTPVISMLAAPSPGLIRRSRLTLVVLLAGLKNGTW